MCSLCVCVNVARGWVGVLYAAIGLAVSIIHAGVYHRPKQRCREQGMIGRQAR